jgi:hypothetical protein
MNISQGFKTNKLKLKLADELDYNEQYRL